MAHAINLAKGATRDTEHALFLCKFCATPKTQQHINVACPHPSLIETRAIHRKRIDEFYMSYRYQHLPPKHRWIIPNGLHGGLPLVQHCDRRRRMKRTVESVPTVDTYWDTGPNIQNVTNNVQNLNYSSYKTSYGSVGNRPTWSAF